MTRLTFTWSPPEQATQNGDIIFYSLSCTTSGNENAVELTLKATVFEMNVDLFRHATTYTCSIAVANSVGIGPSSTLDATTGGKITYRSGPTLTRFYFI